MRLLVAISALSITGCLTTFSGSDVVSEGIAQKHETNRHILKLQSQEDAIRNANCCLIIDKVLYDMKQKFDELYFKCEGN